MPISTILEGLEEQAARDPDATAIVCSGLGSLSFSDLVHRIRQIGAQLLAAGIGPGSRVGIALQRGPEAALLNVGVSSLATVLPLNPSLSSAELQAELAHIKLDALIVPGNEDPPGWAADESFGLFKVTNAAASFDAIALEQLRPIRLSRAASPLTGRSWAAIFRTSGTTGVSKRVPVTHGNLIEMARKKRHCLNLTPADRSACILPLYYRAGFGETLMAPLLAGCSVALPKSASTNDLDRWLAELRPTWLTAAPAFLQLAVEKLRTLPVGSLDHSLRFVLSAASYLPEATRSELARLLAVPVAEFYGLSEAGMVTIPALPPATTKTGSVGRIPEGDLAIWDDEGGVLPPGRPGHVMLRGANVTPGYLLVDIDGTPEGLKDGWLASGDLGTVDEDGFLTIIGRTKEIINRGGEKISPYDVEKALLCHPAVREAAAFALPHPRLGEHVGAAVVLRPGAVATSTQLIDFIYDRLAPFQVPRHVHLVESLPVGATGKISRLRLSADFASRQWSSEQPTLPLDILIAEIWRRLLGRTDIGLDDDFFEIGGDSLQAAEMLLELEESTRHHISPSDVRTQLTIRQLSETLVGTAAAKQEVMTTAKGGKGIPLFLCHGDFSGWGFYAFRLAELLEDDGPVYLLHPILDDASGIDTIEEMARRFVLHIEAAAPVGPIRVAGFCNGGLAALEVASRLERAGRTIDKVVLIDTFSLNARAAMRAIVPFVSLIGRITPGGLGCRLRRSGHPSLWVLAEKVMQGDFTALSQRFRTSRTSSDLTRIKSPLATYGRAMSKYLPPKIRAELICLLSEECLTMKDHDVGPWKNLAQSVIFEGIPGQHHTAITQHVGELADCFNRILVAKTEDERVPV
jgi:oxalate---CoA ligase